MSIVVCINHQLMCERNFPQILWGVFYHSNVVHNVLLPETLRNLEPLKSLHGLEMNGVKVNSLGNIKQVQVEPPVPRSQLICTGYFNAMMFMPVSQFPVMIKKPIKTTMVSCSLAETWKHKKIDTEH